MSQLVAGEVAPAFTLPDADGNLVSLSDFPGRKVVVYFYPAAMTPGCTTQAVDFTAARDDFLEAGIDVIGISPDAPDKLAMFRQRKDLRITLLSDESKETLNAYGAWGTKVLYGKSMEGVLRSTFLIDVDDEGTGTIELAQYNVRATGHVDRLRRDLGLLHL
ncbi:thioredoxin-dependent thiol peroxidase [Propionimicrobium sp. PCR01-08-3]|uniref:thioredoxin-dependent thiol peroxidase n=1 Tax=Propionimicrobium sp. PCR01-08-3 TaxID=3052086 RepID=UPI00255D09F1|nr:thioredoxin-dependent thiol peroxidase [Propionimicrobium sp. PCR01-08-3]WIY83368.1 thioredoxin-dependent thiol peroxidase [Propionimicrobium sp. PCR01-08-3]